MATGTGQFQNQTPQAHRPRNPRPTTGVPMRLQGNKTTIYRIYNKTPTRRLPITLHQRGEIMLQKRRHGQTPRLPQPQLPTTVGMTAGEKKRLLGTAARHGKPTTMTAGTKRRPTAIRPPSSWTTLTKAPPRIPTRLPLSPNLQKRIHPAPSTLLLKTRRPAQDSTPRLLYPQRAKMTYLYPSLTKDPPSKGDPP